MGCFVWKSVQPSRFKGLRLLLFSDQHDSAECVLVRLRLYVYHRAGVKANVRRHSETHVYGSIFLNMTCSSAMFFPCSSLNVRSKDVPLYQMDTLATSYQTDFPDKRTFCRDELHASLCRVIHLSSMIETSADGSHRCSQPADVALTKVLVSAEAKPRSQVLLQCDNIRPPRTDVLGGRRSA